MPRNLLYIILSTLLVNISIGIMYIGITWYILISHNGEVLYGLIILTGTITGFVLSNFIGKIIDRHDREKIFVLLNIIISISFLIIFLLLIKYIKLNISVFFILYMVISVYSMFYWNVITSITQQVFSINEYKSINSKIEIIGQVSAAFSIIGGLIIYTVNFLFIIIICSIVFAISAIIFRNARIPKFERYDRNYSNFNGFKYLKNNKYLLILLLSMYTPFIAIVVGNYTKPSFIVNDLNGTPIIIGAMESIYAISAVITSLLIPRINEKNELMLIIISMAVFSAGTIAMGFFKIVILFLGFDAIQGYANPAIRIIRKTIMMKAIPKNIIGRIYGSLETFSYMIRIIFLTLYILIIRYTGAGILIEIQGVVVLLSVLTIVYSFRKVMTS